MYNTLRLVVICPSMGLHKLLWLNRHNILNTVQSDQLVQACGSGNVVSVASLLNGGAMVDSIGTDEFGVSDVIYHTVLLTQYNVWCYHTVLCANTILILSTPLFLASIQYIQVALFMGNDRFVKMIVCRCHVLLLGKLPE